MTVLRASSRAALGPLSALLLCGAVACSGARAGTSIDVDGGALPADVATTADLPVAADLPPAADVPVMSMDVPPPPPDVPPVVDVPPPPPDVPPVVDAGGSACGSTYPAGPYGSAVGALFRPFALTACNRSGADATWRFDGPDFFTSSVTVVAIAAAWSVPDQRQASMLQAQIVDYYAGRGVRFVQVLVQNADMSPASAAACNAWVSRYGISFPELIDPTFVTRAFAVAFPAYVIVDRCGRIVHREYGSDVGLSGMRTAIDDALASTPSP